MLCQIGNINTQQPLTDLMYSMATPICKKILQMTRPTVRILCTQTIN
jgi:hypothetical protein